MDVWVGERLQEPTSWASFADSRASGYVSLGKWRRGVGVHSGLIKAK